MDRKLPTPGKKRIQSGAGEPSADQKCYGQKERRDGLPMDSKAAHLWVAGRIVPPGRSLLRGANLHAFAGRFNRRVHLSDSAHAKSASPDEYSAFACFE